MVVVTLKITSEELTAVDAAAVAAQVNRSAWLRAAISEKLTGGVAPSPSGRRARRATEGGSRPGGLAVAPATAPQPAARAPSVDCRHPANRRIGDYCGACGGTVLEEER